MTVAAVFKNISASAKRVDETFGLNNIIFPIGMAGIFAFGAVGQNFVSERHAEFLAQYEAKAQNFDITCGTDKGIVAGVVRLVNPAEVYKKYHEGTMWERFQMESVKLKTSSGDIVKIKIPGDKCTIKGYTV